jgi:hypothetical protein
VKGCSRALLEEDRVTRSLTVGERAGARAPPAMPLKRVTCIAFSTFAQPHRPPADLTAVAHASFTRTNGQSAVFPVAHAATALPDKASPMCHSAWHHSRPALDRDHLRALLWRDNRVLYLPEATSGPTNVTLCHTCMATRLRTPYSHAVFAERDTRMFRSARCISLRRPVCQTTRIKQ